MEHAVDFMTMMFEQWSLRCDNLDEIDDWNKAYNRIRVMAVSKFANTIYDNVSVKGDKLGLRGFNLIFKFVDRRIGVDHEEFRNEVVDIYNLVCEIL